MFVINQCHDHSVQVKEEHQQMETQLEETFLLVLGQSSENLCGIQQVVLCVKLVDIVCKQWQVEQEAEPVSIDQEQCSNERMQTSFRHEPWVQLITQLNRVDVVALQIGIHDGKKHLRE